MDWINDVQKAVNYMEEHLLEPISIEQIAGYIHSSSEHFQKMFHIITGFTPSEYLRNRRLSLAGQALHSKSVKVIDAALQYGYETPESFCKAFSRFHGFAPSAARSPEAPLKYFSPLTIQTIIKGGFIMARRLIPNVDKLYEIPSENYMFPSCMRSALSAIQSEEEFDFLFFAAVTGDLFVQTWLTPKWQYNDSYSTVARDSGAPLRAAFDACGYEYEYVPKETVAANKTHYVRKIVDSIDQGLPVLTFGIVGPPICSIICGYDENGDTLIGWSQFTDENKEDIPTDLVTSDQYFQVRNGLDRSEGLVFFGKKKKRPDITQSLRQPILNIPKLAALNPVSNILYGKKAFDAWADSLLCDECFQNDSMLESPLDTYGSCMVLAGTNMFYMQQYLDRVLDACPDWKELIQRLKDAYQKENEALQKVAQLQGGFFFDADRRALLNKEFRLELSQLVRKIGECYEQAANVIPK